MFYYILFFLFLGLLIYALLWQPDFGRYNSTINELNNKLVECQNAHVITDKLGAVDSKDSIKINKSVDCDAIVKSGGQGLTTTRHELGSNSGIVAVDYNMNTLPDEIKISYDDVIVYSSKGLVAGSNRIEWKYEAAIGKPAYCIVEISAPYENTAWTYILYCPQ